VKVFIYNQCLQLSRAELVWIKYCSSCAALELSDDPEDSSKRYLPIVSVTAQIHCWWLRESMRVRILVSALVLLFAMAGEAFSEPRRILLLHSFGPEFSPWNQLARILREELRRQSKVPLDIFEASLATARYAGDEEGPFADYLQALFAKRRLDLVITIGSPAATFVRRNRQQLFPSTPALYAGLDQRRVPPLTENDAVVAVALDPAGTVESVLRVLPKTTSVAVVIGNSPIEKFWLELARAEFQPLESRVKFIWFNELPFEEMLKQASALPPQSAVLFGMLVVDATGVAHEEGKAFAALHAVANAPMFAVLDPFFGQGVVGGALTSIADLSRQAATVAVRILDGEAPSSIKVPPIGPGTPRYDWRELQRWNISENQLPAGSEIYFRVPGPWEQYRLQISAVLAALLLQAAVIVWLVVEHRRRNFAEAEASDRRREVIRLNRITTANVLSSSIAHQLNQPLGAILSNAEAAQMLLKASPLDLVQIGEILSDIVRDEQRAGEIILGLKKLLNPRKEADLQAFDLNETVPELVKFVTPEIAKRNITLRTVLAPESLPVRADPIRMQQVVMNLVVNAMDAMEDAPRPRNLTIRTHRNAKPDVAEVSVSDSGTGIREENLAHIFDAFVTTKPQGTGLGLPIARTIIESYGGTIWAENRLRGAVFCFTLPLAQTIAR
jgi:signal transduction histidine kinase